MREPNEPSAPVPPAPPPGDAGHAGPPAGDLAAVGDFRHMMWRLRLKRWAPLAIASAVSLLVGILLGASLFSGGSSSEAASPSAKPCAEGEVVEASSAPSGEEPAARPRSTRSRHGGDREADTGAGSGSGHF